ncbi:membrane protein [Geobacter sp. AOG2]|nr:membrane protein [Geobacter sp. AOG2]
MQVEWWYWIIAGFCLIGLELIVPSFTIIWFGLGALVVGGLKGLWPEFSLAGQLFLWTVSSISFTVMWFKYLKPKANRTHAGQSKEGVVGETGIIIRGTVDSYGRGTVRFRIAVLGADEWGCYADEALEVGDSVRVIDIEGQILKVIKI